MCVCVVCCVLCVVCVCVVFQVAVLLCVALLRNIVLNYLWCCVIALRCDVIGLRELFSCNAWNRLQSHTRMQCHAMPDQILLYRSITCNCGSYCHQTTYYRQRFNLETCNAKHAMPSMQCNPTQCKITIRTSNV